MSGISIFMYHQIGKFAPMKTHRANYCDVDRFRAQMALLKRFKVSVLSLDEAARALTGEAPMPKRAAVLTFDDGCLDFYENAAPILLEFGYPAMVYVIAAQAGDKAAWLAAAGHPTPPLMTYAHLRELTVQGVGIGSHAYTHVRLAELDAAAQLQQLTQSKALLEQELGQAVKHVCYPYGSHNLQTLLAAQQAGYLTGTTCERAAAMPGCDLLALPRKAISYGDNRLGFMWKLFAKNQPKIPLLYRENTQQG